MTLLQALHQAPRCDRQRHHLGISERHDVHVPHPPTRELLDIASNHADGEEAVAATLNTPQGKGKQVMDRGEGTSSRFKKKKKNDKRRRDDNFVAAVERKT
jgi:hypothetical protein